MILTRAARRSGLSSGVELLRDESAEGDALERSLALAGVRLALPHRAGWRLARKGVESLRGLLRAPDGSYAGAVVVQAGLSRAGPGFRALRVEGLRMALRRSVWAAAADALTEAAHRERR